MNLHAFQKITKKADFKISFSTFIISHCNDLVTSRYMHHEQTLGNKRVYPIHCYWHC